MNHEEMVKEGNRLNAILEIQTAIVHDPGCLKEQATVVLATGEKHKQRLAVLADVIHGPCSCGHEKAGHKQGRLVCLNKDCSCKEWAVDGL